jgi:hypothetical protein
MPTIVASAGGKPKPGVPMPANWHLHEQFARKTSDKKEPKV